jgi:hypothetical protein
VAKPVFELQVYNVDAMVTLLTKVVDLLVVKRDFAQAMLTILASRQKSGVGSKWTLDELALVEVTRSKFMPKRLRANGETRPLALETFDGSSTMLRVDEALMRAIPSEAMGSDQSTMEPLETRGASIASSNRPHECPASVKAEEDIVRSSAKVESWDKEPSEKAAHA